jgi:hypothetical protein
VTSGDIPTATPEARRGDADDGERPPSMRSARPIAAGSSLKRLLAA